MRIFEAAHWLIPWLILIIGMYATIKFVRSYTNDKAFVAADQRLITVFSRLMVLQAAVGLVYFLWRGFSFGDFPVYRILHGIVMLTAALIPHFSVRWKDTDDSTRFLNNFYILLASFLLMLWGLSFIPAK